MNRISCVYTGASPGMIANIEHELKSHTQKPYILRHDTNPEIIARISRTGAVSPEDVGDLLRTYTHCLDMGADILINVCSSVGDIADRAKGLFAMAGMKIVCIDDEMCKQAVERHQRIGVLATLRATLSPTCRRLLGYAKAMDKDIDITELLADNAYGIPQGELSKILCRLAAQCGDGVDALVLAQASMAECERAVSEACGKPVYSSPRYCAAAVSDLLENMKCKAGG